MNTPATAARLAALHAAFKKLLGNGTTNLRVSPLPRGENLPTEELELRVDLRSSKGASAVLRMTPRGARLEASSGHRTGELGFSHLEDNLNVHLTSGLRWGDVEFRSELDLARALVDLLRVRLDAVELLESTGDKATGPGKPAAPPARPPETSRRQEPDPPPPARTGRGSSRFIEPIHV
jgi:hypothetical protein